MTALILGLIASPARAQSLPDLFQTWLSAINANDKAAITAFYTSHRDESYAAFALDVAEDSCGFDLVRVETQSPEAMQILLAEKCHPTLHRLTIEREEAGNPKLKTFKLLPFAQGRAAAWEAVSGIATRLAARDQFAGSLLIIGPGGARSSRSWGKMEPEGRDIDLDTPLFLASAGKMFTAVAVLQLVEAGKIDLDAPFGRYLTDYPNAAMAAATIRQLLQHRGGTGDIGILARDEGAGGHDPCRLPGPRSSEGRRHRLYPLFR